jgi:hypothetical protein
MRVHINALIFETIVFDITINYAPCDLFACGVYV